MDIEERIESFALLGKTSGDLLNGRSAIYQEQFNGLINHQHIINPWFTPDNVRAALKAIAGELTKENLALWTSAYPELKEKRVPLTAGVIMAGNIPLTGFHDFLSVLISGNRIMAKTSSKDTELIRLISEILCSINQKFNDRIEFTAGILANFDVVIATGSNNSSRYFEYYFGKYPSIIRKNRNSVAVLDGDETDSELENLGKDIFSYFGLGCRNVSKIYLPEGFDISVLIRNWHSFSDIINHTKYANNYDYNKAVYLVNKEKFHDTGFLLLKEENRISSPVSVVYYESYSSLEAVEKQTEQIKERIQCIVGKHGIPFGKAQSPHLWDYADNIDTIGFLLKINNAGIL